MVIGSAIQMIHGCLCYVQMQPTRIVVVTVYSTEFYSTHHVRVAALLGATLIFAYCSNQTTCKPTKIYNYSCYTIYGAD